MRTLPRTTFPLLLSAALVTSSPALPPLPIYKPSASISGYHANSSLGASVVDCGGTILATDLRRQSALNALDKISRDSVPEMFAMRETDEEVGWNVVLPYRIISDDGTTYIDITTKGNQQLSDTSTWREIHQAADAIFQTCVVQPQPKGGKVTGIGWHGLLTATLSTYDPSLIRCVDATHTSHLVPRYESCADILARLPWDEGQRWWGSPPPYFSRATPLPLTLSSPDRQCNFHIALSTDQFESCTWISLWAAAVAANEMCVKQGKSGAATGLGGHSEFGPGKLVIGLTALQEEQATSLSAFNATLFAVGRNITTL